LLAAIDAKRSVPFFGCNSEIRTKGEKKSKSEFFLLDKVFRMEVASSYDEVSSRFCQVLALSLGRRAERAIDR
jgi:hypothetical protein